MNDSARAENLAVLEAMKEAKTAPHDEFKALAAICHELTPFELDERGRMLAWLVEWAKGAYVARRAP